MRFTVIICDHCQKRIYGGRVEQYRIERTKRDIDIGECCVNRPFRESPPRPAVDLTVMITPVAAA